MTKFVALRTRSTVSFWCTLAVLATASTASAQFKPRIVQDPTVGDKFTIEAGADIWFPTADLQIASGGSGSLSGISGTQVDAKRDLGLVDKNLPVLNLVLRSGRH